MMVVAAADAALDGLAAVPVGRVARAGALRSATASTARRPAACSRRRAKDGRASRTNLAENITGMRVVTAFNRQEPNLDVFNRFRTGNTDNNVRVARVNGVYQPLLQLIGFIGKVIILAYGGYLVVTGRRRTRVGAVVAAYLYWDWFMNPILNFGNFYNQLMMAMAGAERVFNLLDTKPDVQDVPEAQAAAADRRARERSRMSPSATTPSGRCCTISASRRSRGRCSRWSARPAAARAASSR